MLESLAAWVLRTYVGEYVENLNTDQLSIGYGTVDLHNLPLKKTALKGLELPLEVKSGFIGHLQLSIPLRRPKSEPWIVHVNKLYLVAGPLQHSEYNEEEEKERERARKRKRLDALEAQWLAARKNNAAAGGFWSGSWWPSLYSSFSTTIVENLQLIISDVHFRYEDATTKESLPFAFGITIAKLSAQSTNESWNPEEIIENERTIKYKLIELQNMAIYWDTDVTLVGDLPSRDLESALQRMINRNQGKAGFSKHQYVLEPTSAQAKMKRNASALPLRSRQMPRFVVDVHVEKIPLSLEETQYKMLITLMEGFERHFRQCRYLKWRPKCPIKNNAREWWQFSINCILHSIKERNMRQTWTFAAKRAHDMVKYVNIYTKHLVSATTAEPALKDDQAQIEEELTFEELVVLRTIAQAKAESEISQRSQPGSEDQSPESVKEELEKTDSGGAGGGGGSGGWQSWVTGWYSWYGTDTPDGSADKTQGKDSAAPVFMAEPPTTKEEEEFLDELADNQHLNESIFNRDQVFAHLNFRLDAGSFKLINTKQSNTSSQTTALPVVEAEFSDLRWDSEMRPRSSTWEFNMSLGALFVRDKLTPETLFPSLVCPQGRESKKASLAKKQQGTLSKATTGAMVMSAASVGLNLLQDMNEPVFEMKFESLSPTSKVAYRLSVTTQPLDVVYNPLVLDHISEFFSHTSMEGTQALHIERQLREVARVRYEELKNQTRAELVQTLDAMMAGSEVGQSKRWDIQLDISAPRFLVPESFQDRKSSVVVIDFGHLSFANTQALNRKKTVPGEQDSRADMEDDSFVTPPSTPPEEDEEFMSITESTDALVKEMSRETLIDIMYERYTLDLSDIQMVVCNVKDNWSEVASKPFMTSDVHVVDKFTITIQLERRLLFTADPQYPAVTLFAKLPNLILHINEHKLQALTNCVKQLSRPKPSNPAPSVARERIVASSTPLPRVERVDSSIDDLYYSLYSSSVTIPDILKESPTRSTSKSAVDITLEDKTKELMEESRMLLVQFAIDRVSLGVHSMGCLIAELQILGVKANYMKRPYDSTISFAVHGVHLVDAIQNFGPEYELLFSSCKPQPVPSSSNASLSQSKSEKSFTETVSSAFSMVADLVRPGSKRKLEESDLSFTSEATAVMEEEDLITFDYQHYDADSPSTKSVNGSGMNLVNLQFNTLNVIANQETLAALVQFFSTSFSSGENVSSMTDLPTVPEEPDIESHQTQAEEQVSDVTEVTASFKSINVLVIRSVSLNGMKSVRKVAEVAVGEVQLNASLGECQRLDGSLGGFRIIDLTPEGSLYRTVCTCGSLFAGDTTTRESSFLWSLPEDMQDGPNDQRAFTFTLVIPPKGGQSPRLVVDVPMESDVDVSEIARNIQINVRVASAQYTHTHRFLSELLLSAGDYAEYAAQFGETLRQAASNVAMGLVSKKRALAEGLDYLSSSFVTTGGQEERSLGSRQESLSFENDSDAILDGCDFVDNIPLSLKRRVYSCITVDSPIVQVPKSSSSTEMLVAHLGKITVRNTHLIEVVEEESDTGHLTSVEHDIDRLFVEIKEMSLYCLTPDLKDSSRTSSFSSPESFTSRNVLNSPKSHSTHILHKTAFELMIDRRSEEIGALGAPLNTQKPTIHISGKVASPLQLELSTHSYHHLLDTIDNIGGGKETVPVPPPAGVHSSSLASPSSQSPSTLSPSSSASNLEAYIPEKVLPEKRVSFVPNVSFGENVGSTDDLSSDHELETEGPTPVRAHFELPHFSIKLCGELNKVEHDFVNIMFYDFVLSYEHTKPTVTLIDVSLGALLVEDLLQEHDSPYRHLISSSAPRQFHLRERSLSAYPSSLSTSCPVVSDAGLHSNFSSSLPHCLSTTHHQSPFRSLAPLRPLMKNHKFSSLPSVNASIDSDSSVEDVKVVVKEKKRNNLVHIKVLLVDKKDDEFSTKHNSVNRMIDVDFNSLEANLNLQTWVIVLEFFGIGVPQQPLSSQPSSPSATSLQSNPLDKALDGKQLPMEIEGVGEPENEGLNTEVKFQVSALTLVLSKKRYPIAKVKAFGLFTDINMRDGNLAAAGRLTSVSVTDMSPHGTLYREKFKTFGDEALSFNFFKYGSPDPDLLRDKDMSLKLRMSSVQYVHTKRFQTELVVFFQHYLQLQEVLGRMRAASEGNEVSWMFGRGTRVTLDIKAGNPVILVPRSAKSCHMLVADLGNLSVANDFRWDCSPGTLSHCMNAQRPQYQNDSGPNQPQHFCLLDSMRVELVDMDLFTATRIAVSNQQSSSEFSYKSQGLKLFKEKCRLNLTVERNLDWAFSRAVPDINVSGRLSSVGASLDYSQYCFILGMLGENLGEPLEEFERPSSVIQDPLGKPPEAEEVWTSLRMRIDLVNVSLELHPVQLFEHPEDFPDPSHLPSLARIDFIKSKFEFESFSDWSKTIDLVSEEVIFEDTRQKGMDLDDSDSCIFTDILLPRRSSLSAREQENSLQFEVHYRDTTKRTLLTFLFDHSRIVLIMDYLLDTYNFIMCRMFKPNTDASGAQETAMDTSDDSSSFKEYEPPPPSASGVATRCEMPAQPPPQKTFEMKVNISGTEFVVLENVKTVDTHAVILKLTAVLAWRPHLHSQKWLSCSVQSLEMFSCVLSCEEDTALSIIDPTSALVELNNARRQKGRKNAGLLDFAEEQLPSLEINLQSPLTMRVSYNDYKLYLSILESVSKQLNRAIKSEVSLNSEDDIPDHDFDAMSVKRLQELGFKESDCIKALQATSGRLEASATWLLENATPVHQAQTSQQQGGAQGWQFAGFEVRAGTVCVCLIDDCGDSDVPLIEFSTQNLYFWHDLQSTGDGAAHCTLIVQYYNRNVSDWEPFLEPWKCQLHWQEQHRTQTSKGRFLAKLDAPDRLDVTVTTTLINMINHTMASWSEDYYRPDPSPVSAVAASGTPSLPSVSSSMSGSRHDSLNRSMSTDSPLSSPTSRPESSASLWSSGSGFPRRRSPFVPFLLRNQTGCTLWFKTVTTTLSKVILANTGQALPGIPGTGSGRISEWKEVPSGGEAPFEFTSGEKQRHKVTGTIGFSPYKSLYFECYAKMPMLADAHISSLGYLCFHRISRVLCAVVLVVETGCVSVTNEQRQLFQNKETHELNIHQVVVQVEGWGALSPVSVDRVGTFFRQARPQKFDAASMVSDLQSARVVFDVSLEGRARKVVTLRSALMIKNKMDLPVEIKLQGLTSSHGASTLPVLPPEASVAIPLRCTSWKLYLRPHGVGVGFCSQPLEWKGVIRSHTAMGYSRECYPASTAAESGKRFRFCVAVKREGYPEDVPVHEGTPSKGLNLMTQPAHTLTIMYPVMLVNLLPCDLSYQVKNTPAKGNIKAGKSVPLYTADPEKALDFGISIENFMYCDNIRISRRLSMMSSDIIHVELQDTKRRSLIVNVKVSVKPGGSLRVSIYAPYWIINNTGIPLVFKQDAVPHDMAGQFDEHEMARSLTPLLFSFSDRDAPTRCQMRIGRGYQPGSGKPVWSNSFSLDSPREFKRVHARQGGSRPDKTKKKGKAASVAAPACKVSSSAVSRQLEVHVQGACLFRANLPSESVSLVTSKKWVYDIGIDVRFGQGRYRDTRIVTLATRYQLENRTQHALAFSQRHFVRGQGATNPEGALTALPGALVLFHWARTDLDQLLCIRLNDVSHCQWSGGFKIDRDDSFHVNMRSLSGCSLFVRVEVVLRGATFHVLFTDASQLPPPFRIDNLSEVAITFYQSGTEDRLRTILQPKQSVPYSWDEPTLLPELSVGVQGAGSYMQYNMQDLGGGERLYYYNPIYVVFAHTFSSTDGHVCGSFHLRPATAGNETSLDLRELVLDVPQGSAVLLRRKEPHRRSQLWRLTGEGLLRHEGSSPPSVKPSSFNAGLVLDIDSLAPPTCGKYVRLVLSKPNPRRVHSQTWSFTEDNRMKCDLPGLYVQPKGGIKGLRDGVDAVLGPANITKDDQIPIEQCINTCKLRPGSGCLGVKIFADGPTRVLQITDCLQQPGEEADKDWMLVERRGGLRQATVSNVCADEDSTALEVQVRLVGGIGISVINSVPEELVFINLEQIEMDYLRTSQLETLEGSIGRIQIDNQLFASQLPVLLYPSPPEKGSKEETTLQQPTLHISATKEPSRLPNVEIFKSLDVSVRKMTLQLEELLLLKLLQFFGYVQQDDDIAGSNEEEDECLYATQRSTVPSSPASLKRYYFEHLQLNSTQLKFSVSSASRLPEDLQSLKSSLGLILVNLEDASIDLESFSRSHPFDTMSSLLDSMSKHYIEEIRSQAAVIVGSVDFLGNPMGLINDVSSGLEGLVKRGNVGGLFRNVAHGVSDSAAKITGSLSDGLWNASMDTKFQESRDAMRAERFGSSKDHFVAGVKGLGMGLVGGLTSIVTQPIEGAHNSGVSGFITGIGKGIVGTFAKPTAGVLDFASGAAAAVRGQATRSSRNFMPKPSRLRRNCFGPSGAIPRFAATHAEGQEIMLKLNEGNFNEKFVLSETVRRDREDRLKAIVTTEGVYFVRARGTPSPESIVLLVRFSDLYVCQPLSTDGKSYIELVMKADNSSVPTPSKNPSKRPRVRCDQQSVAQKVAQKINYAKNLNDEVQQTVKVELKEPTTPV